MASTTSRIRTSHSAGGVIVESFRPGWEIEEIDAATRVTLSLGEGPGEFLFPGNLQRLAGDSVQVYDRRQGRVSVFSPEGEFAYGVSVQKAGRRPPTSMMRAGPQLLIGLSGMTEERRLLAKSDVADLGRTPVASNLRP
jgi:hypothetical protein